jgi:hypothetical protein
MSALSDRIARMVADAIAGDDMYCELQDVILEVDALCAPVRVPEGWPKASEEDASRGWTLDYGFLDRVTDIAKSRTDYTTSAEASEQVLIAALEVLATTPKPTAGESSPAGVEGLLADLETIWHSVSDDKETNAAYQRLKSALARVKGGAS